MGAQEVREEEPVFESGIVMFSTGDLQVLELNLTSKRIDVDVKDKAFLKRIIQLRGEISPPKPTPPTIKEEMKAEQKSGSALSMLKSVAEALSSRGITLIGKWNYAPAFN